MQRAEAQAPRAGREVFRGQRLEEKEGFGQGLGADPVEERVTLVPLRGRGEPGELAKGALLSLRI